jgi:hypothetical protein
MNTRGMNTSAAKPGTKKRVAITVVAVVAVIAAYAIWQRVHLEQYRVIDSPDSRFRLVVYRRQMWPSAMPGQGSDAPGVVRLYDRSGHLLDEAEIPMVQRINDLEWTKDRVTVPLVFDWKLPD